MCGCGSRAPGAFTSSAPGPLQATQVLLSDEHVLLSAGQGTGLVSVSAGEAPAFCPAPLATSDSFLTPAGEEEQGWDSSAERQLHERGAGPSFLLL